MSEPVKPKEVPMIGCSGGCGKRWPAEQIEQSGWGLLAITGRYRCGDCERALWQASTLSGVEHRNDPDPLPPASLGALKKLPERPELRERVK